MEIIGILSDKLALQLLFLRHVTWIGFRYCEYDCYVSLYAHGNGERRTANRNLKPRASFQTLSNVFIHFETCFRTLANN